MNTSFTLKNVELTIAGETIKIGEISTKVEDYNLLEGLEVAKNLPGIIRELKDILIEGINEANGEVAPIPNPFEPPFDNIGDTIKQHAEFVKNNTSTDEESEEEIIKTSSTYPFDKVKVYPKEDLAPQIKTVQQKVDDMLNAEPFIDVKA